ncbi:CopD family protein [Paenibacillus sp. UMB7766-LJ446]|uniref:copper resistance D family protein n=1 Tax=Paenibacillus sp. UMB7766-LJ446 TaxID=3046313 RepID=UPI00254D3B1B|nr:CopD family protein [Paenibacillus sp. UMB7766-LJ446]MDK8193089.1 CopD family protein [Paenibacillus sp. UMB7766-LJ446]
MTWYWLGEPVLYSCLAILFGGLILPHFHQTIRIPRSIIILAITGIAVFSFLPILRIIVFFSNDTNLYIIFRSVMLSFAEGKAYMWTLMLSALSMTMVLLNHRLTRLHSGGLLLFAIGIVATLSWSSHSSSYFGLPGFWTHFIHLIFVTIWAGILSVAGRYMPNKTENWKSFLSWYHPFAVVAMIIILLSGLLLNFRNDPDYVNSWVTSYGQSLLLKHLLIIPMFVIAFFNGFIIKRKLRRGDFNPSAWLTVEAILILLIYVATGFLNQQPAPHELNSDTMKLSASGLYDWFNQGRVIDYPVQFTIDPINVFLYILALGSILIMYLMLKRNKNPYVALICGVSFTVVSFVGLMNAIS